MARNRHHLSAWQCYSDFLACVLGFFILISSLLIMIPHQPQKPKDGIKPKAEYLITLVWDDHRNIDLDLWLHHGSCTIFYNSRECENISLDRDSRGFISNMSRGPDGTDITSPNQEVIAIRAVVPGDYLTAVNYYADQEHGGGDAIDCTIELVKLNPTVTVVNQTKLHLVDVKQTLNAIAFHVDLDGTVTIQPLPPENLIALYANGDR